MVGKHQSVTGALDVGQVHGRCVMQSDESDCQVVVGCWEQIDAGL
jgi:hypothetical protein